MAIVQYQKHAISPLISGAYLSATIYLKLSGAHGNSNKAKYVVMWNHKVIDGGKALRGSRMSEVMGLKSRRYKCCYAGSGRSGSSVVPSQCNSA